MSLGKKKIQMQGAAAFTNTDNFNTVLYTGNGSSQTVTGVGFEPDMVWAKARSNTHPHVIFDIVRGENKQIQPNETSTEVTRTSGAYEFESDGFTVSTAGNSNNNSYTYVAWCWKAGGAAVSNTDGTITSTVSANTDAGFSVISYSGNQTAATVGHGLSQAPEMIIAKSRTVAQNWAVYHKDAGSNYWLQLNGTIAKIDEPIWNDTTPTDSVFSMNANVIINKSGSTNIAYAFHSVDGYQKIGSYTGVTGDITVTTGFRPRFVMLRRTNSTGNWEIHDSTRFPTVNNENGASSRLRANDNSAEASFTNSPIFFTDTGFVLDSSVTGNSYGDYDANGSTYIYLAIA